MSQVLRVAWYRFQSTFSHRWGEYLSLIVVIGLLGGLAMGSVAGARRTASSFPTFLASTNPSNTQILAGFDDTALGQTTGYNPRIAEEIGHLPLVKAFATSIGFDGNINLNVVTGLHPDFTAGETPPTVIGSFNGYYTTIDRMIVVKGRLANPNSLDEAVINTQAAKELGVHVGSVVHIPFYNDAEANSSTYNGPPYDLAKVKVVGEVVINSTVVQDDIDALGSGVVVLSAALTRHLATCCAYYSGDALQLVGGDRNTGRVLAEATRLDPLAGAGLVGEGNASVTVAKAQQSIKPEAIALGVFGGITGLAVLLIAGLMIGRILGAGVSETRTLRALGADQAMTLSDAVGGLFAAVVLGAALGVAVAIGLSPLSPLGPVRPIYPDPGVAFDWTVLGLGLVALIVVLSALGAILAKRELNRITSTRPQEVGKLEPGVVRSVANSGLPIAFVTGLRLALGSGRGKNVAPVRSAILGTVLAIVVLVTTVTFGASLNSLVSHPALYGWNWNYALLSGFVGEEDLPQHQITTFLDQDRDIQAWSGASYVTAKLNNQSVPMLVESPNSSVGPPLLSGHGLAAANQVVLGATTLAALGKKVGETVTLSDALTKTKQLKIVGTATMATISKGLEMGTGALVAPSDFPAQVLNAQQSTYPGPNFILVRIKNGVSASLAYHSLQEVTAKVNALPNAGQPAGGVVAVLRPAEISNYRSMGTTPVILGAGLAIGTVIALGLTLIASVRRRRRELALLKTFGFTQRQLAAAVAWQSSISVAIGVVVGVPLGIVLGRFLWNLFAREINAVPQPAIPALSIVLISLGALVLANIVAAVPGRMAARTPTALLLRAE